MTGLAKDEIKNITAEDMRDYMYGNIQDLIEGSNKLDNVVFHYFMPPIPFGPELASFMDIGPTAKAWRDEGFTIRDMMRAAVNFSTIVDYVPVLGDGSNGSSIVDMNALISSGTKISNLYKSILENSRIFNNERSAEDKEKLRVLRELLYVEPPALEESTEVADGTALDDADLTAPLDVDDSDFLTDIFEDGGLSSGDLITDPASLSTPTRPMQLYEALRSLYDQTELVVFDQLKNINPNDPNAGRRIKALKNKLRAVKQRWEAQGHKTKIENILARIEQLSQGGMAEYKSDLKENFEGNQIEVSVFADEEQGMGLLTEQAYYTALRPNGILNAPGTQVSISNSNSSRWSKFKRSSTSASFKAPVIGIFGGANASVTKFDQNQQNSFFKEDFEISFEIVQGIIDRPWFAKDFVECRAYSTVDPQTNLPIDAVNQITELSDGKNPPSGQLPALPTTVYFVRNLKVKSKALANLSERDIDKFSAGGGVSIFGFGLEAEHKNETIETNYSRAGASGEITATGTYLVGMSSVFLKKAPNPDFESFPKDQWS